MRLDRWMNGFRWVIGMLMWFSAPAALACTTVALGLSHRPVIAYSFDYAASGAGFLFVNPAPAIRSSILDGAPAQWTVRHGSVTFNQMGPGMPAAGMNTAGLVVSLMWNDDAVFGGDADAPVVTELEFIQRLLDTSASVDAALHTAHNVRIQGFVPIHFFLADRTGDAAIATPTPAGLRVHRREDMPVPALTNTSYVQLTRQLTDFEGFGGDRAVAEGDGNPNSIQRFLIAAKAARQAGSAATVDEAFSVLAAVANRDSRWQIVFDPVDRRIAFRIVGRDGRILVELPKIDFRCRERPLSAALTDISPARLPAVLAAADPVTVGAVTGQVLASLPPEVGVGPEMADGLVAGLLGAIRCVP